MENNLIKALFLDVGGVLLSNGWGQDLRFKMAQDFNIESDEMEKRHRLIFDTYETGKTNLDTYLKMVIFYKERPFTPEEFKSHMFEAVRPYTEMIEYIKELKVRYKLKIGVVSNEGRELAIDRFQRFNFSEFIDFFIVSSFVHIKKPDLDIYRIALDASQIPPEQVVYVDDRALLIDVAKGLGIQGIHHTSFKTTQETLNAICEK